MIGAKVSAELPDLRQLNQRLQDLGPMLRRISRYTAQERKRTINAGRDPYGQPYRKLKRGYAIRKRRRWGSKAILTASGAMKRGYSNRIVRNGIEEYYPFPSQYHQDGDRLVLPTAQKGLPAREQAFIDKEAARHFRRSVARLPIRIV